MNNTFHSEETLSNWLYYGYTEEEVELYPNKNVMLEVIADLAAETRATDNPEDPAVISLMDDLYAIRRLIQSH